MRGVKAAHFLLFVKKYTLTYPFCQEKMEEPHAGARKGAS